MNTKPPAAEACSICGRTAASCPETQRDYLRTVYVRSGELDSGYYRPRLTDDEMFTLKSNPGDRWPEVLVCSDRTACRQRRRAASRLATP